MLVVSINVASQGVMHHYAHLGAEQRDRIAELHAEGKAVSDIGRDSSTLSRKLERNGRHTRCKPHKRLSRPSVGRGGEGEHIADERWSPEQIDERLCLKHSGSSI